MTSFSRTLLVVALSWSGQAVGQTLVVTRSSNLRVDPSTKHSPIAHLAQGDTVQKVEPQNIGGYFQVNFRDTEGWVWSRNVKEVETTSAPPPPTASSTALGSATHHKACPIAGEGGTAHQVATDKLKNRTAMPAGSDFDASVTLAALLHTGDDTNRFNEAKAGDIVAYVDTVKNGNKETVNCHSPYVEDYDTHIEISAALGVAAKKRVIVEVTPRMRLVAAQQGLDWSTSALKAALLHRWVRVKGWMLWDYHHTGNAQNTNPGGSFIWRATVWEIHPITSIAACSGGSSSC